MSLSLILFLTLGDIETIIPVVTPAEPLWSMCSFLEGALLFCSIFVGRKEYSRLGLQKNVCRGNEVRIPVPAERIVVFLSCTAPAHDISIGDRIIINIVSQISPVRLEASLDQQERPFLLRELRPVDLSFAE